MKYLSFLTPDGRPSWGRLTDAGIIDLSSYATTLRDALAEGDLSDLGASREPDYQLAEVTFLPVITWPDKIICVGLNYRTHVLETGRELPAKPSIFTRFANSQIGHGQPMIRPAASDHFDYEGELAVIIGKTCRHVPAAEALSVVAGYACYNDGSVRDWQRHTIQFTPGKNFPGTGGFGPWMVTEDAFRDFGRNLLLTRLNGIEMQRATLDDLIFDVPALIEYCSTFTQLEPGDVIITGTTGGVGAFRKPPVWMKPGDVCEVEIEGIGTLANPIVDEKTA